MNIVMNANYESIIGKKNIYDYSYNDMLNDLETFKQKFTDRLTIEIIGKSRLGRDIPGIIIGNKKEDLEHKLLIIAGQHARERHGAWLIMRQIEHYCENWNSNLVEGLLLKDFFKRTCIYYIPMTNPDGHELSRRGIDSIPTNIPTNLLKDCNVNNRNEYIEKIKSALEYKVNSALTEADFDSDWNYNGSEPTKTNETVNGLSRFQISNYKFRNNDMYMWKANARGIDLHYNWWSDLYSTYYSKLADADNDAEKKGYKRGGGRTKGWFASENEMGTIGVVDENKLILNWIDKYKLMKMVISIHGRGPTHFWNYKLSYHKLCKAFDVIDFLSKATGTPYSESNNARVGFVGYMEDWSESTMEENKYINTYYETYECGWSTNKIQVNGYCDLTGKRNVCPLPASQTDSLWNYNKVFPLLLLHRYGINNSNTRYPYLSKYQVKSSDNKNKAKMYIPIMYSGEFTPVLCEPDLKLYAAYNKRYGTYNVIGNRCFVDIWFELKSLGTLKKLNSDGQNIYNDKIIKIIPATAITLPKSSKKIQIYSAAIGYVAGTSMECKYPVRASVSTDTNTISLFNGASYLRVKDITDNFKLRLSVSYTID